MLSKFVVPSRSNHPQGFSLIEVLAVMAIAAVLAVLAVSAFNRIGQAGNLTKTSSDIASLLEQARSHAMAQNTYVWVGFEEMPDDSLMVAVVASRNGESNPAPADLVQLGRVQRFPAVGLAELEDSAARPTADLQLVALTEAIRTFSTSGANAKTFNTRVIQFNNRGESSVRVEQPARIVEIGLQERVNGQVRNPENYATIQVGRLTGSVSVYRP